MKSLVGAKRTEVPLEPRRGDDGGVDADGHHSACLAEERVVDGDAVLTLEANAEG